MGAVAVVSVGDRFGRLVVEAAAGNDKFHCRMFVCRCDCGAAKTTSSQRLRLGKTQSCGCLQREHSSRLSLSRALPRDGASVGILFARYRDKAKQRGLAFALDRQAVDRVVRSPCFYCGQPPSNNISARRFAYSGIDRVDSAIGYLADNVVPCCWVCNRAKGGMPKAEFLEWALRIANYQARFIAKDVAA